MTTSLQIVCCAADETGRRIVIARYDFREHREVFNTADAYRRRQFAEGALEQFGLPLTQDALADIDAQIVQFAKLEIVRNPRPPHATAESICLADVPAANVDWLWTGRIPIGKVTLIAGDPGLGKSLVTLDMAARVSTGAPWPKTRSELAASDGTLGGMPSALRGHDELQPDMATPSRGHATQAGGVVLLSAEDDLADTIRPRLEAAGADCSRIVAIRAIAGGDRGSLRSFELGRDLSHLTSIINAMRDCRLVVIDPISAYLGQTAENVNAEVRSLLGPLADLAARHHLAVVALTHLRKGQGSAICRAMGSVAFVAAARTAWIIVKDPDQPNRRLFLPMKNNLGSDKGGMAYTIESRGDGRGAVVRWSEEEVHELPDNIARKPAGRPATERNEVARWLTQLLAGGPQPTTEVHEAAAAMGYSRATVRRAFRDIGGKAVKQGSGWFWKLPEMAGQAVSDVIPCQAEPDLRTEQYRHKQCVEL